ncbi:MAG TPA: 16S rRNA (cytosine(1402)-N(4))-methyltransferase RsmH [Clostridia bacterium]|nr:MAG: Ribosomal RNA small subunit methyltransferase H [Firmicutes bacterium ADurb.Bin248]HOG01376.1 16S rRNA (cytosine(1402)-N(4))-methyltransferase RsmH [Clostridia bacterium]HOS18128.1 16S rRNA (cytosine(1402)-N(4))-methyltransferase RsmH [Clostridia bacterium]HPK15342.1 16S rRNA (cytosine(1402)-N(4))-methyltransferase RsmH [Clostridia bacterium]
MTSFSHIPILLGEAMALLRPERGGVFVDGTLGGGGHAQAVLERLPASGKLYGIDRDGDAVAAASERLSRFGDRFCAIRGNFFNMKELLAERGVDRADGILLDLGVSSFQLDAAHRGFSYSEDAPLDMRMDARAKLSAYDVVNGYPPQELARVIRDYGEERYALRIAGAIARERQKKPIQGTIELSNIIRAAMPAAARREPQHPAKRTFQAIRIEVNGELEGLDRALDAAHSLLGSGGVLAVISFHSLEDRIAKLAFRRYENPCTCDPRAPICTCSKTPTARVLTRKPVTPGEDEIASNPRSRSAKLRAIEKL